MNNDARHKRANDDLRKIAEGVFAATGEEFFRSLVESLSQSLELDYAFVVKLNEARPGRGCTIAGYGRGQYLESFEYELAGTPCQEVLVKKICCCPANAQEKFPNDHLLAEMGIESYAGIPLVNAAGRVLGLIAAMHGRPMDRPDVTISALRIWAARASAELERLSAEAALRQSEARFRSLFEQSPDAIFVEDLSGNVLDVNPAACALHEAAREELIGSSVLDLVPPENRQQVAQELPRLVRGELDRIHGYSLTRSGRAVPVAIRANRIDYSGQPALLLQVRDITDRVQAEQALRDSESRLERIVQGMPVMMDAFDEQGRIIAWNRECERVTGYLAEEIVGNPRAMELLYPDRDYRERMVQEWQARGNDYYHWEWELTRKDGTVRTIAWSNISTKIPVAGWASWGIGVDVTERKRATEALQASEERFRALVEHGFDGINIFSAQGAILYSSPANRRVLGYEPAAIHGRDSVSFVHPDDASLAQAKLAEVVRNPRLVIATTIRLKHKDGDWRWVEVRLCNLLDHSAVQGIILNWRDVTDRKEAEERLRESEERFRILFDSNPLPTWVYDLETLALLAVNRAAVRDYGYSREEFLAMTLKDIRPAEDVAALLDAVSQVKMGKATQSQWRHRTKGGKVIDVQIRGHGLIFAGRPAESVIAEDITERKQAEQALQRHLFELTILNRIGVICSEAKTEDGLLHRTTATISNSLFPDNCGFVLLDPVRGILVPHSSFVITNPEANRGHIPPGVGITSQVARTGQSRRIGDVRQEPAYWAADPTTRSELCVPIKVGTKVVGVVNVESRVLNAFSTADEQLVTAIADLVGNALERLRVQEELAVRHAELLHASRLSTIGQMVATMSHEISQPLAALGNFSAACCRLLDASPPADPELFRNYVGQIARQSQRAAEIVKRMRAFGSRSTPDREACDLNWLVRDSVDLVASELRRCGVTVQWELAEPPPVAAVDRIQLQQVMVNLLANSCDAMQEVEPARRVVLLRSYAQHDQAVIDVVDNGIGLTPEVQSSLFRPFFTTKPDGMGLGLSICREIVEAHGGRIEGLASTECGATFRLRMPLGNRPNSPHVIARMPDVRRE